GIAAQVVGEDRPEAADAGLPREMEDPVHSVEVQVALREIEAQHVELAGVLLLQRRVVVVRERVDGEDLVPTAEQGLGQVRADEARRSRHQIAHGRGAYPAQLSRSAETTCFERRDWTATLQTAT